MDNKMQNLQEMANLLESNGEKQKTDFEATVSEIKSMFVIPGVLGPEPKDAYENLEAFITNIHSYRSEAAEKLDKRMREGKRGTEKICESLKEELWDFMKLQEKSV